MEWPSKHRDEGGGAAAGPRIKRGLAIHKWHASGSVGITKRVSTLKYKEGESANATINETPLAVRPSHSDQASLLYKKYGSTQEACGEIERVNPSPVGKERSTLSSHTIEWILSLEFNMVECDGDQIDRNVGAL